MEPLFLPVLHSFENNNIFTGSFGALRFRVIPSIVMLNQKEVNLKYQSGGKYNIPCLHCTHQ